MNFWKMSSLGVLAACAVALVGCTNTPLYYAVAVKQAGLASGNNCGAPSGATETLTNEEGQTGIWVIYTGGNGADFLQGVLTGSGLLVQTSAPSGGGYSFKGSDTVETNQDPDVTFTRNVSVTLKPGSGSGSAMTGTLTFEDTCDGADMSCSYAGSTPSSSYDCTTTAEITATPITGVNPTVNLAPSTGFLPSSPVQE